MSYSLIKPFNAKIKQRTLLNKGSTKQTFHIVLDIAGSDFEFNPGDSVAIFPSNDPSLVELTIKALKAKATDKIIDPKSKQPISLHDFLSKKVSISKVSGYLVKFLDPNLTKEEIHSLIREHFLFDLLEKFSQKKLPLQEICELLLPILPRLYSISSSQKHFLDEIHLTIAHVSYITSNYVRNGVCTQFLCYTADSATSIPIYLQPTHKFRLTQDENASIIMIGAGCGLAPFVAFMQERYESQSKGKNWLFFGERNRCRDFYYEEFWHKLENDKFLKLTTAFSRDQPQKIYVQDKLLENGKEVCNWIKNGAFLYVCGDSLMAKDVDSVLQIIFRNELSMTDSEANLFLRSLREQKKYLRDVY